MRCPGCDYALWNLTARLCPECGRPFAPSEFDFIVNSVRFCCPHCNQDYYGTGPRGHLEPVEFDCAKCHRHIHMDQMVLLPTEGVKEEQTEVDSVPWLSRAKLGRFKAWFSTVWRVMFDPPRLARATPDAGGVAQAWLFSLVSNVGFLIFGVGPVFLLLPFFVLAAARPGAGPVPPGAGRLVGAFAIVLVACVGFFACLFPVWGLLAHLILRITGPTRLGPGASVRTLCYASGANACAGIPCLGGYLSAPCLIWTGISAAAMLRVVHGVGWVRALIAGLFLPVAALGLLAVAVFVFVVPGMTSAAARARQSVQVASAAHLSGALGAYRARHNDQFPPHAIALMQEGDLVASDLTVLNFGAAAGDPDLSSFQVLEKAERAATVDRLTASLPKNVIAHRLGDVVFTYHGIDPAVGNPGLWVAIESPEGAPAPGALATVGVATLGGSTLQIPRSNFPAMLARQNQLRAPLPPLPDPSTIRAGVPATGP